MVEVSVLDKYPQSHMRKLLGKNARALHWENEKFIAPACPIIYGGDHVFSYS
jgi:hypothetical protein